MQNSSIYNSGNFISLVREFITLTKPRVNLLIMFTAIVGTRAIVSILYENKNNKGLSI